MAFQDGVEAVDAFAGAAVHFVRHGAGTGLPGSEAFAGEFVSSHEAQGFGETGGTAAEIAEGTDNPEVQAAGIDLANRDESAGQAEVAGHFLLQGSGFLEVAAKQIDLIELRAGRALEATHRVAVNELLQGSEAAVQFFRKHGEPLAQGGGLGCHVVGAGGEDDVLILQGPVCQGSQGGDAFEQDDVQGAEDLQLLHIFREITAGHAFVNVLVAGQFAEFINARLHVVTRGPLAAHDGGDVDAVADPLIVSDGIRRNIETQFPLGLHHGDP